MKTYLYQIENITNLHVGNGEANEGVVDKLIQKDVTSGIPIINASSLKGAMREHLNNNLAKDIKGKEIINHIFGNEVNIKQETNEKKFVHQAGAYRFFDAHLLSMPVRSDKTSHMMASCYMILNELNIQLELFNIEGAIKSYISNLLGNNPSRNISKENNLKDIKEPVVSNNTYQEATIEDLSKKTIYGNYQNIDKIIGSPSVLLSDTDFKSLCEDDHLPIIARNHLDNGVSQNLWYEQVLPRSSHLYFIIMVPDDDPYFEEFNKSITSTLVQIGANATVGCGYCKIECLSQI